MVENALYILVAYLVGSIPFGYLAGRLNGVDLREHGSHNIGATNAVRVLGKRWGIPVFFCDFLKGYLPLMVAMQLIAGGRVDVAQYSPAEMGWCLGVMAALVLGHTFTCFLGFRGGKGVATMAGCLVAFLPVVAGAAVIAFVVVMALSRYVSLSSLVAGLVMVLAAAWRFASNGDGITPAEWMALGMLILIFILVLWKHRSNIGRICRGTEHKAFSRKK